jgi:hypothetical protein
MELLLIDKNGWTKSVKIEKAITRLGTAASNDVQLQSQAIAAVHVQLIYTPELPASCKLVNLASEIVVHGDDDAYPIPRLGNIELRDGDEIELGEFRVALKIPLAAEYLRKSNQIDASLSLPEAVMRPDMTTIGQLTIKNIGMQPDCQFRVILQGLPQDCYQIDPIPLMYPDAQEDVRLQFFHRKHYPSVGFHDVSIHISAPTNYPGEELIIKQGLYVVPVFDQEIALLDDVADLTAQDEGETSIQEAEEQVPEMAVRPVVSKPVIEAQPPEPIQVASTPDQGLEMEETSGGSAGVDETESAPTRSDPQPAPPPGIPESPAIQDQYPTAETAIKGKSVEAAAPPDPQSEPVKVPDEPQSDIPLQAETADTPPAVVAETVQEIADPAPETEPPRAEKDPPQERPKVKVARKQFDEFWEEE